MQIYDVASRFDLIIVEDDPYRVLSLPENPDAITDAEMPGVQGLPPSLLSLDTEGRVIHLESLSKWICPGSQITMMTGRTSIQAQISRLNGRKDFHAFTFP
jgi:DNA-binding transcriptional MocR family regulator